MAYVIPCFIFVLLELLAVLVNGVVCQVHAEVVEVAAHRTLVLDSCKSRETFLIDVAPEWRDASHQHVDPEVELETIDKQRFMEVLLRNIMFPLNQPIEVTRQENTNTLAIPLRLNDESFRPFAVKLLFKTF